MNISDKQLQNRLQSFDRSVTSHFGMCEGKLRQINEDPVAPALYPDRINVSLEPSPESMIIEDPLMEEAFGIRKHATISNMTTANKASEPGPDGQTLTHEENRKIQDATNCEGKALYFFYGTLMDPASLQRVTGLQAAPRMRPAHVLGYTTKLWGPFPVLLHGRSDDVVRGVACEIEGSGFKRRLKEYEGRDFDEWELDLRLDKPDGIWEVARGVTFKWVGPRDELEEGIFRLSEWQSI